MAKLWPPRISLRTKLLLPLLGVAVLPVLAVQWLVANQQQLLRWQQQLASNSAQLMAQQLHNKPQLFRQAPDSRRGAENLYLYSLSVPPRLQDGDLGDWQEIQANELVLHEGTELPYAGNQHTSYRTPGMQGDPLDVRVLVAEAGQALFLNVRVRDHYLRYASGSAVQLGSSDAVLLNTVNADGVRARYWFSPQGEGQVQVWQAGEDPAQAYSYHYDNQIEGHFTRTVDGYQVELKLPRDVAAKGLAVGVEDVDEVSATSIAALVATSDLQHAAPALQQPQQLFTQLLSPELLANYSVQVVDADGKPVFEAGSVEQATGLWTNSNATNDDGWFSLFRQLALQPLYQRFFAYVEQQVLRSLLVSNSAESPQVTSALTGVAQSGYRQLPAAGLYSLEVAWPIRVNDSVRGALVLSQNLQNSLRSQQPLLQSILDGVLLVSLLLLVLWWWLSGAVKQRLLTLRAGAERSIDLQGRLVTPFMPERTNDEIGDLSRSVGNMLERQGRYHQYLENLTARLSHELRTPVTVVRTSLENLRLLPAKDAEQELYIQRAEDGITRLNVILTNMSEATRLEQILQGTDKEVLALNELLQACAEQYRQIYPQQEFLTQLSRTDVLVNGSAEHLVQLFDKVVANAVEFSKPGRPIRLTCELDNGEAVASVSNYGSTLDPIMKDRLFDSMVSIRPEGQKKQPHLGLGLHIARLIADFHQGTIYAENLLEEEGVIVVLRIPSVH